MMKETLKMWRMMCLLKKHRHAWRQLSHKKKDRETEDQKNSRLMSNILEIGGTVNESKVLVIQLAVEYQKQYGNKPWRKAKAIWQNESAHADLSQAMSIIESCVADEYVKLSSNEKDDSGLVQITLSGKKFASLEGLLKKLVDDFGSLRSVAITSITSIIAAIGVVRWDWMIIILKTINPMQ